MKEIKKVVVVDDDPDLLSIIDIFLTARNIEVIQFENGTKAWEFLSNESNMQGVNLVILDRLLPDSDGIEILKRMKGKYQDQYPVLILSAVSGGTEVQQGISMGASGYVTKPFNLDDLYGQMQKVAA